MQTKQKLITASVFVQGLFPVAIARSAFKACA